MADLVELDDMKAHLGVTDGSDDLLIEAKILAAEAHVAACLGYPLDEAEPVSLPALAEAVKLYAAHLYENREAAIVGVSIEAVPGFAEIVASHREYTF